MPSSIPDPTNSPTFSQSYVSRANLPQTPPMTAYLLQLMAYKKSNLCLSADVSSTAQLLDVADEVGSSIVMLKTHADMVSDWSERTIRGLADIAHRKKFLLFEDRKFADIGHTVQNQYGSGVHRIASWAHYINAYMFTGPAIIDALKSTAYSALAAANSTISTSITSGGPIVEDQLNEASERLKNTFLASRRRRGRSGPSDPDGDEDDDVAPKELNGNGRLAHGPRSNFLGAADDDEEDEEVRIRRESQILRKPSVVSVSTTITSTTEYISPPATGTEMSFGSVFSPDESTPDEPPTPATPVPNPPSARGLLLVAQLSSKDNMLTPEYTARCVAEARRHRNFVLGFIAQQSLNFGPDDNFVVFTPGIQLPPVEDSIEAALSTRSARTLARDKAMGSLSSTGLPAEALNGPSDATGDSLGQQYNTPRKAVLEKGSDVIIVGRGILNAHDRAEEAERYRREGWTAYLERLATAASR